MIRRYTKQTLSAPTGPLTVVTSKRKRLTFLECPADSLAAMMDVAKVADIVLLMIDGNFGFEMETMEFLNVLASSGMPESLLAEEGPDRLVLTAFARRGAGSADAEPVASGAGRIPPR